MIPLFDFATVTNYFSSELFIWEQEMNFDSLGIIETSSISASFNILSGIQKEKKIKLAGKQVLGGGMVTLFILGDLGAIKRAISYGKENLPDLAEFRSSHIIPLPHKDLFVKIGLELK